MTIGALAVGLALIGLFVVNQPRGAEPLMPLRLFADRVRAGAYTARQCARSIGRHRTAGRSVSASRWHAASGTSVKAIAALAPPARSRSWHGHSRHDDAAVVEAIVPGHGRVGVVRWLAPRAKQQSDA